jgi:hypothetical protein
MGGDGGLLCGADPDLAPCPRLSNLNRTPRPIVGTAFFKKRQNMFRAICRPNCQETVPGNIKGATAMDCNKTPITHGRLMDNKLHFARLNAIMPASLFA